MLNILLGEEIALLSVLETMLVLEVFKRASSTLERVGLIQIDLTTESRPTSLSLSQTGEEISIGTVYVIGASFSTDCHWRGEPITDWEAVLKELEAFQLFSWADFSDLNILRQVVQMAQAN